MEAWGHRRIVQWFFNDNFTTCLEHPAYSPLTGVYFGPVVLDRGP
jgi:hypothetical protein